MGPKISPTAKNMGRIVLGVRIGEYARSRCWRKAVLGGLRDLDFLSSGLSSQSLLPALCDAILRRTLSTSVQKRK
jgi:hypothetical protein